MRELKTVLNADKFATFWMFLKSFDHSFILTIIHSNRLNASRLKLGDFEKHENK